MGLLLKVGLLVCWSVALCTAWPQLEEEHGLVANVNARARTGASNIYPHSTASTILGCECKGACESSPIFECAAQPYCLVKSKNCKHGTADYSYTNLDYYDYCTFPPYQPYEGLAASAKHTILSEAIDADATPATYPAAVELAGIFAESVNVSFVGAADVFPLDREKYIHSVGTVAEVSWVSHSNHPYTGIFASGAKHGYARMSSAVAPDTKQGHTPGSAWKWLRDGVPSANFVSMPGLDAQLCSDSTNFFAHNFSNHLPQPVDEDFSKQLLKAKFWQASYCPLMVGLSDMAAFDESGKPVPSLAPVFPYQLVLVPQVQVQIPCGDYATGLKNFEKIAAGTTLFKVLASASPKAPLQEIASIVSTSQFRTSNFGDQTLFFKHQWMEDDFARMPEWLDMIDKTNDCGMSCVGKQPPTLDSGCTSPFPHDETPRLGAGVVCGTSDAEHPIRCPFLATRTETSSKHHNN